VSASSPGSCKPLRDVLVAAVADGLGRRVANVRRLLELVQFVDSETYVQDALAAAGYSWERPSAPPASPRTTISLVGPGVPPADPDGRVRIMMDHPPGNTHVVPPNATFQAQAPAGPVRLPTVRVLTNAGVYEPLVFTGQRIGNLLSFRRDDGGGFGFGVTAWPREAVHPDDLPLVDGVLAAVAATRIPVGDPAAGDMAAAVRRELSEPGQ
jgi:hypothetical protein